MRDKTLGNDKPERVFYDVRYNAAAAKGAPVVFLANGTNDGIRVTNPSSAAAAYAHSLFAGVAPQSYAAEDVGEVLVGGLAESVLLLNQTRAASTDSYASAAAISVGQPLQVQTALNCFTAGATVGGSNVIPFAVAFQTLASSASSASATSDTSTAVSSYVKAWLRAM